MRLDRLPNAVLEPWLAREPVDRVFPLYACRSAIGATSPVVVDGDRILAAAQGPALAMPVRWVVAEDADAAALLVASLDGPVEADLAYGPLLGEPAVDVHLARPAGASDVRREDVVPTDVSGDVVLVDAALLAALDVPEDVRRHIGRIEDLPPSSLWGRVVGGELVAICDTIVRWGDVVSISQVWTTPPARRRGHARALVAGVLARPELAGAIATWLADATNTASIALARGLGFVEVGRYAFKA